MKMYRIYMYKEFRTPAIQVQTSPKFSRGETKLLPNFFFILNPDIHVAKTKVLISFAITAKLISAFVFRICRFLVFSCSGSNNSA